MSNLVLLRSLLLLAGCTILSAFYSGSETASYAVSRIRLRYWMEEGYRSMRRALYLLEHHTLIVIATLVGTNLSNYFAGEAAYELTRGFVHSRLTAEIVSALWLTPFILLAAEVFPKVAFRRYADAAFPASAAPLYLSLILFYPAVIVLSGVAGLTRMLLPGSERKGSLSQVLDRAFSRQGLREYVETGLESGAISRGQYDVMAALMEGLDKPVEEYASPLVFLPVVAAHSPVRQAVIEAYQRDISAVLVQKGRDVSGMVYLYDLADAGRDEPVDKYLRPVDETGAGSTLREVLDRMKESGTSVCLVRDEAGGVLGAVSRHTIVSVLIRRRS